MRDTEIDNTDQLKKLITIGNYVWNDPCLATTSDASPKIETGSC